jgi:hypothetical protein
VKCPICGGESRVLDTRDGANLTTRRRRRCLDVDTHTFTTIEGHATIIDRSSKVKRAADTILARIELWHRDIEIARQLYTGYKPLAERFGLTHDGLYAAAQRGRAHIRAMAPKKILLKNQQKLVDANEVRA